MAQPKQTNKNDNKNTKKTSDTTICKFLQTSPVLPSLPPLSHQPGTSHLTNHDHLLRWSKRPPGSKKEIQPWASLSCSIFLNHNCDHTISLLENSQWPPPNCYEEISSNSLAFMIQPQTACPAGITTAAPSGRPSAARSTPCWALARCQAISAVWIAPPTAACSHPLFSPHLVCSAVWLPPQAESCSFPRQPVFLHAVGPPRALALSSQIISPRGAFTPSPLVSAKPFTGNISFNPHMN